MAGAHMKGPATVVQTQRKTTNAIHHSSRVREEAGGHQSQPGAQPAHPSLPRILPVSH